MQVPCSSRDGVKHPGAVALEPAGLPLPYIKRQHLPLQHLGICICRGLPPLTTQLLPRALHLVSPTSQDVQQGVPGKHVDPETDTQ
jgi:hypothetical protein